MEYQEALIKEVFDYILYAEECEHAGDYVLGATNLAQKIKEAKRDDG